jgi:hypothetical protein
MDTVSTVSSFVPSSRIARLFAALALTLALVAAMAPGFGQSARAGTAAVGSITTQTYTCPDNYTGNEYLTDCTPGAPYQVTVGYPNGDRLTDTSGGDGFATFAGTVEGQYDITVEESVDTNRFYFACFDGADIFQFDGASRNVAFDLTAGDSLFCRFYVTPLVTVDPSPSAAPSVAPQAAGFTVQARICPEGVELTPAELLAECDGIDDVLVEINPGESYDAGNVTSNVTSGGGFAGFDVTEGTWTVALGVPGDFASFYFACFDTTYGTEVFVKDGTSNITTLTFEGGTDTLCRWYIFPEDAGAPSASPSSVPSVKPSAKPSASAGAVIGLPSTGSGDASGTAVPASFVWGVLALALAAAAIASRRLVTRR